MGNMSMVEMLESARDELRALIAGALNQGTRENYTKQYEWVCDRLGALGLR